MQYNVTLDFKRGPSFGPVGVIAMTIDDAVELATREAKGFGFKEEVKKSFTTEIPPQ